MKHFLLGAALALGGAGAGEAATFTFPSSSSVDTSADAGIFPGETGFFFFEVHAVSEVFTDTGLASVISLALDLEVADNFLREAIGFGLSLNGTVVGSFTIDPGASGVIGVSFDGFDVGGVAGGDFAVSLFVNDPVSPDAGAIRFLLDRPDSLTLEGPALIPLPASLPLLLAGLGALGLAARRRAA